jgi:hypothetical protein
MDKMIYLAAAFMFSLGVHTAALAADLTSGADRVGIKCEYRDGVISQIAMAKQDVPQTSVKTLVSHCALQRAVDMGGTAGFHDYLVNLWPVVSLPPTTPGGGDEPDDDVGTMPNCGVIFYEKQERAACKDGDGNEGTMTTTYSCRVMQVPKQVGDGWECVDDPDTEVCVYVSDSDCEVTEQPEDILTPW